MSETIEDNHDPMEGLRVGAGIDWTDPNSPLAPAYFQTGHILAAAFLGAFFSLFTLLVQVYHTDVWAHLRFGEVIVQTRTLPQHEPFPESYADRDAPYIHYQWLTQAGGYLLYQWGRSLATGDSDAQVAGGALVLTTAHALVVVLRLLVLFVAFRRLAGSPTLALFCVLLTTLMGGLYHVFILRPQMLGELGFALLLLALSRPVLSRMALVGIPLVFLIWANSHGSFAMGFLLLGAAFAGHVFDTAVRGAGGVMAALCSPRHSLRTVLGDPQSRRLGLLVVLSVLATFVNPHGPLLLYESATLAKNPNIPFMEEWKALPIRSLVNMVFVASVFLVAILLRWSPERFTTPQLLLLLGFGIESIAHARFVVWWVMLVPWVAAPHLAAICRRSLPDWVLDTSVPSFRKTVVAIGLALALLMWSAPVSWALHKEAPEVARRVTPATPLRAADFLRERNEKANEADPLVVFASETLGDYLLWDLRNCQPTIRLLCYTHVHLFTPEHWTRCMAVKTVDRRWQSLLDEWQVDLLVLEYDLYEQREHRRDGRNPGFSDLIDRVREARQDWRVIETKPVFIAERIRRP